jgi:hypothetical protein
MIPKSEMPHFFYDEGQKSFQAEVMVDFFISWTLRCAEDKYKEIDPNVQMYSKTILLYLLKKANVINNKSNIEISSVHTEKQWDRIDLLAEVIIKENNTVKNIVLVFENKLYTHVHDNQLRRYIKSINKFYDNHIPKKKFEERYFFFLTAADKISECDKIECEKTEKFIPLTVFDLRNAIGENAKVTGNYLFDEFWFRYFFYDKGKDFTQDYLKKHFVEGTY